MFCYFCMCYAGYDGIGETCWCWGATPESDSWVLESAALRNSGQYSSGVMFSTVKSPPRCFHIDVSSLSRLVLWRCLADSVLASSSAGRCDVRATRRWTLLTCARQFLLWAYCTYLLTYCDCEFCVVFILLKSRTFMVFQNLGESSFRCIISVLALVCSGLEFSRCQRSI